MKLNATIKAHETEMEKAVVKLNKAVGYGDLKGMDAALEEAKVPEKAYAEAMQQYMFTLFKESEKPIEAAVSTFEYTIKRIERDSSTGKFAIVEKRREVDLKAFCKFAGIDYAAIEVYRLGYRMTLGISDDLQQTAEKRAELVQTYKLSKALQEEREKTQPIARDEIAPKLQSILDSFMPGYKIAQRDVAYFIAAFTKVDNRNRRTLSTAKERELHRAMLNIAHGYTSGMGYELSYRKESEKPAETKPESSEAPAATVVVKNPKTGKKKSEKAA